MEKDRIKFYVILLASMDDIIYIQKKSDEQGRKERKAKLLQSQATGI